MSPWRSKGASRDAVQRMRTALAEDCDAVARRLEALITDPATPPAPVEAGPTGSALDALEALFRLTPLERGILALAAGAELHPGLSQRLVAAGGHPRPDVGLALQLFGTEAWDALCPAAVLRRMRLVEVTGTAPFLQRRIATDERLLHFLMGLNYLDDPLAGIVRRVAAGSVPLHGEAGALVERIATAWRGRPAPLLMLAGTDRTAARALLAETVGRLGMTLLRLSAEDVPAEPGQRHAFAAWLDRELLLSDAGLLIEAGGADAARAARLADALATGAIAIAAADPEPPERGPRLRLDLPPARLPVRREIWRAAIGAPSEALGEGLDRLAGQFALDGEGVAAAVDSSLNGQAMPPRLMLPKLWEAARSQGRRRLDGLAERIESRAAWDDLVLPEGQKALLRDLAVHVREAWRVREVWGWEAKSPRGLGTAALFAGPSGTGKTFAAEVLASALALDLYRIDLSQVVSKYIGETEKNLSRIFAAAEDGGAILLFDEADALFGKRSEVKDSHDRYANIEVSYLLQRMEAYRGLAILTTNQKSALDGAFLRRLRYVVQFPFPDAAARAEIWARIFPRETPVEGLDPTALARMSLTGGSIRSVTLNASFLAAGEGGPVTTAHIMSAAQREFAKLEKPMATAERRRPS